MNNLINDINLFSKCVVDFVLLWGLKKLWTLSKNNCMTFFENTWQLVVFQFISSWRLSVYQQLEAFSLSSVGGISVYQQLVVFQFTSSWRHSVYQQLEAFQFINSWWYFSLPAVGGVSLYHQLEAYQFIISWRLISLSAVGGISVYCQTITVVCQGIYCKRWARHKCVNDVKQTRTVESSPLLVS